MWNSNAKWNMSPPVWNLVLISQQHTTPHLGPYNCQHNITIPRRREKVGIGRRFQRGCDSSVSNLFGTSVYLFSLWGSWELLGSYFATWKITWKITWKSRALSSGDNDGIWEVSLRWINIPGYLIILIWYPTLLFITLHAFSPKSACSSRQPWDLPACQSPSTSSYVMEVQCGPSKTSIQATDLGWKALIVSIVSLSRAIIAWNYDYSLRRHITMYWKAWNRVWNTTPEDKKRNITN